MVEFILSLPDVVGAVVVMASTTAGGITVYVGAHKLIAKHQTDELKDPTSNLFRVVGLLVGLMLSLTFAEVVINLRSIENALAREAVAVSDTYYDLEAFDVEGTRHIRDTLIDYTRAVIDDDWPALANDRLGARTEALRRQLAAQVMSLESETPVQEMLWGRILADIDALSDYRLIRLDNALAEPPIFVYVVGFGFLVTMAFFGTYQPQGPLVAMLSLYTLFIGFVLYLTLSLSDPFQGGLGVSPSGFQHLVETLESGKS